MVCAICKDEKKLARLEDANLSLYRCGSCGHVFKVLPKEKQEHYGEDYFLERHKNWFANPDYPLFELLRRLIIKNKGDKPLKILDVGCGTGNFLKYLKIKSPALELYGIDLVDSEADGVTFIKGDILTSDIPFKFDVITNLAAIEHIDSPHHFISRIKYLLASSGIVFTVTDNDDGMVYGAARMLKRLGIAAPYDRLYTTHHMQCFSNRSLKLLLEMNGLSAIMHKRHNHPVAAVDYPESNLLTMAIYKASICLIFAISSLFGRGILQINVSKDGK